jgi:carboxymethylenebutenolidase
VVKEQHVILPNRCEGYLFLPEQDHKPFGCIIVFHERYGLVQHTLDICKRLAMQGYIALAPDLFSLWEGDKEALKRGDVRAIVSDRDCAEQLDAWIGYMQTNIDEGKNLKFVLMGVCQSGRYPIVVASERADIAACIIFYGATHDRDWVANDLQPLPMPVLIGKLQTPLLFLFAEQDHTISMDNISRIRATLEASDLSYRMKVVPQVPHGFLNDTMPGRYRPKAAEEAWIYLLSFLDDVLEHGWPHGMVEWDLRSIKSMGYDFKKNIRME